MNTFQPRPLRTIGAQGTYNQTVKPVNGIKNNILSLKSLNLNGNGTAATADQPSIAALKQRAADELKGSTAATFGGKLISKIPVSKSRIPVSSSNLQENRLPSAGTGFTFMKKSQSTAVIFKKAVVSNVPKPVIENIDLDSNCFLLSDYVVDIYEYLREVEIKQKLNAHFLEIKGCVAPHMRAILLNWIIQVHSSFGLTSETLYIATSMIDRYFAREPVSKSKIQLIGITALFIASKYEEIYYPEINEFVNVCDKLYTKKDIIRMELQMLDALNFELGRPLPLHFLRRGSKAAHVDGRTHMLAKYLCELMLIEYEAAHWNPSLLAATALYTSLRLISLEQGGSISECHDNVWTPTIEHYTGYSKADVLKHAPVMCRVIVNSENSKFQSCRKKYSAAKFMEISKFPQFQHKLVKKLAALSPTAK